MSTTKPSPITVARNKAALSFLRLAINAGTADPDPVKAVEAAFNYANEFVRRATEHGAPAPSDNENDDDAQATGSA